MTDKEKYDFIDHVVHLTISAEDRLLNEHGGEYSRLQEDGIDSNEYYRIIMERVINILKKNKNYMQEEPVSDDFGEYINELSKQFPEVSFAKVCKIATRTAKWLLDVELPKLEEEMKNEQGRTIHTGLHKKL